jgi:hypothetical protein
MIAKSKTRQPRLIKSAESTDIENRIRDRAYQLYEQRGSVDGFALDDWFQAEAEVLRGWKQPKVKSPKRQSSRSRVTERA